MSQIAAMFEETGLDPFDSEELATFLTSLETLVGESAPEPGLELAALLASGLGTVAAVVRPIRKRSNLAVAAVLAATGIVSTGVAAAANELPPVAQRIVADFSSRFLPFDFPQPRDRFEDRLGQTDPDGAGQDPGPGTDADADGSGSDGLAAPGSGHQQATDGGAGDGDLDDEAAAVGTDRDGGEDGDADDQLSGEHADDDDDATTSPSGGGSDDDEDETDHDADDSSGHGDGGGKGGKGGSGSGSVDGGGA